MPAKHRVSSKQRLDIIRSALVQLDNLNNIEVDDLRMFVEDVRNAIEQPLEPVSKIKEELPF